MGKNRGNEMAIMDKEISGPRIGTGCKKLFFNEAKRRTNPVLEGLTYSLLRKFRRKPR